MQHGPEDCDLFLRTGRAYYKSEATKPVTHGESPIKSPWNQDYVSVDSDSAKSVDPSVSTN